MDYNPFIQIFLCVVEGGVGWGGGGLTCLRNWSKMLFLVTFRKITTYWPPLDERVRSSFAESCRSDKHYLQNLINVHRFYVQKILHYIEN